MMGGGMPCKSCGSVNQKKFSAEMGIHFLGLENIDKPTVWVFPEVIVCLDCGTAEFAVPETELRQLARGDAAAAD
jgi:ssDNA-binding Zn-finger/Zn-ribbon topoisomerase 1